MQSFALILICCCDFDAAFTIPSYSPIGRQLNFRERSDFVCSRHCHTGRTSSFSLPTTEAVSIGDPWKDPRVRASSESFPPPPTPLSPATTTRHRFTAATAELDLLRLAGHAGQDMAHPAPPFHTRRPSFTAAPPPASQAHSEAAASVATATRTAAAAAAAEAAAAAAAAAGHLSGLFRGDPANSLAAAAPRAAALLLESFAAVAGPVSTPQVLAELVAEMEAANEAGPASLSRAWPPKSS